jgi:hypothetical protein
MIVEYLNIDLIKELGLDELPEGEKKALEDKMLSVLNDRLADNVYFRLSEEAKEKFDNLPEDANIAEFVQKNVPEFEVILAETVAEFKKEMLEIASSVKRARAEAVK